MVHRPSALPLALQLVPEQEARLHDGEVDARVDHLRLLRTQQCLTRRSQYPGPWPSGMLPMQGNLQI